MEWQTLVYSGGAFIAHLVTVSELTFRGRLMIMVMVLLICFSFSETDACKSFVVVDHLGACFKLQATLRLVQLLLSSRRTVLSNIPRQLCGNPRERTRTYAFIHSSVYILLCLVYA